MGIFEDTRKFEGQYARRMTINGQTWQYYRLGRGKPILWLTGGLRRAGLAYDFLEGLAESHMVIAPDYPPVNKAEEFIQAFDAMLDAEKVSRLILAGQSYGSLLAQAYLSERPNRVESLIISSGGPVDYGQAWLAVDYLFVGMLKVLPESIARKLFLSGLRKVMPSNTGKEGEWLVAVQKIVMEDLTRADLISHFAVAADIIKTRLVRPDVLRCWPGQLTVLSASNDPTQNRGDLAQFEKLFGRQADRIEMGDLGHAAVLYNPERFLLLFKQAIANNP
jgi:pimeloyl-ACP methyl ester carboxylesterase